MKKYDEDELEIHIDPRGHNKWKWMVCEKNSKPIKSGEVVGARAKAVQAAHDFMHSLIR